MTATHWVVYYDHLTGEPYGQVCHCDRGEDHDGLGHPVDSRDVSADPLAADDPFDQGAP